MKSEKVLFRVPELVRQSLEPYAEIFESIVIPMVKHVPLGLIGKAMANRLDGEIVEYQNRKKQEQHCFLVYYGLMLCCMYSSQEDLREKDPAKRSRKLALIGKARTLICLTYQHMAYELIPFML